MTDRQTDICFPPTVIYLHKAPRFRLITYIRRAFSVSGPTVWNSFPDFIRDPTSCFTRLLKRISLLDIVHLAH